MCKIFVKKVEQIENVVCPVEERETSITFGYQDDTASIYTSDNTVLTKIKKCMQKEPDQWKCYEMGRNAEGRITGYFFVTNKNNIHLRSLSARESREYTEEERKAMGARLHKNRT